MDYITGNKDTDFELLMKLSDHELGVVCQANKKVKAICDNQYFWMKRAIKFYNIEENKLNNLKKFLEFTDYKSFYIYLKDYTEQLKIFKVDYDTDDLLQILDKKDFPEYVDIRKFLLYFKRKIFEESNDIEDEKYMPIESALNIINEEFDIMIGKIMSKIIYGLT